MVENITAITGRAAPGVSKHGLHVDNQPSRTICEISDRPSNRYLWKDFNPVRPAA